MNPKSRNEDFLRECRRQKRRLFEAGETLDADKIAWRAACQPAPGYYISYEYALRVVGNYMKAKERPQPESRSGRRRMVAEIAEKCRNLMDRHPSLTLGNAIARVLNNEEASSFFFTRTYARHLYYKILGADHRREGRRRTRKML